MSANLPRHHHLQLLSLCPPIIAQPAHLFSPRPLALAAARLSQGETHEISLIAVPNLIAVDVHPNNLPTTLHLVSNMSLVSRHQTIFRTVHGPTTGPRHRSSPHTAHHRPYAQTTHLQLHTLVPSALIKITSPQCQLSSQAAKHCQVRWIQLRESG